MFSLQQEEIKFYKLPIMTLDTTYYYRLANNFLGANTALDVNPNGSGRLMMAPVGDFSGQYWKPVDLGGGRYAFRTLYLGDDLSLDIINDGVNTTPCHGPDRGLLRPALVSN